MLAACSRDAMSARREHVALAAKQKNKKAGGGKAGPGAAAASSAEPDKDEAKPQPHPGDEGSLRRWEELLRSVDVNGGRWRSDVLGGGFVGE